MQPKQLALGVLAGDDQSTQELTQYIKDNNLGGMMVYNVTNDSLSSLSIISQVLYGEDTIAQPDCLS
jgi:GH18 family chitinase